MTSCHETPSQGTCSPNSVLRLCARRAERVRLPETLPDSREAAPQTRGTGHGLAFGTHGLLHRETRGITGGQAQVRTRDGGPGAQGPQGRNEPRGPPMRLAAGSAVRGCGIRAPSLTRLDSTLSVSSAHTLRLLPAPRRLRRAPFSCFSRGSHHLPKYAIS